MTNRTCVDWSAAILQAVPRSLKTGHPNIHSPRRLFNSRRGLRDWFGYQLTWTIWQPELAARHNGGEYSAASPPTSVSPSRVFTYRRAHTPINSLAPAHRELRSVKRGKERKRTRREKRLSGRLWYVLKKHTWLLHRLMLHSLNTSVCVWDGRGGTRGGWLMSVGE